QHFTLYCLDPAEHTGATGPEVVVVHGFGPAQIDNNLGHYVANELLPLLTTAWGRMPRGAASDPFAYDEQAIFEHCVGAIVRSLDGNERRAWHRFYDNSLAALERAMAEPSSTLDFISPFGAIYRQLMALVCGRTVLDAGTCFGFLPLLLARQGQSGLERERRLLGERLAQIVGCDLDSALVGFATAYAAHRQHQQVRFVQADLLANDFARLGAFDTVTAIHVLEHLEYDQTAAALANLWAVTGRRLIVAVPLERSPDPRFGHRQVFDEGRLLALGRELGGRSRYLELHGGWLIVDKGAQ
ncbi:MAG: class I SAM-dependent methyltransferase, partial [Chloroflexales bacterium]|nr:class I SAM-dependent methyltransferase [Chloroflexales bacterium]